MPASSWSVLAMLLIDVGLAGAQNFEGRRVAAVEYSPAEQPLATEDLEALQTVRAGEPYRAKDVGAAIDALFATRRYTDIRVEAEPQAEGVKVRFVTVAQWFVGGVSVEGKIRRPPNRGQLINTTNLMLGTPYEEADLKAAEDGLRRLFESNGLYEADLKSNLTRSDEAEQIHFTFRVKTGKRARYERPAIRGDLKLSEDTIIAATGWRYRLIHIYKKVNADRTRNGVRGIQKKYQSKGRLMARVELEGVDYDAATRRLRPKLNIEAGPLVELKAVEAKVSAGTLRKQVPIYEEQRVDRDLLVEGARNLRDYFQAKGYYDVDIDFRQRQEDPEHVVIEYLIAQGQRYKVMRVGIEGSNYFPRETIEERLFVQERAFPFRRGRFSESLRKKDEENIANLFKANGFRDVKVTSTVERGHQGKADQLVVDYRIDQGPQWFVDSLTMDGVTYFDEQDLLARLNSSPGQPFSELNVATDRTVLLSAYYEAGYPEAGFEWSFEPATEPNHVNVTYKIAEGPRQFVRDVLVSGLNTTRRSLVQKHLSIKPGDALSPLAMLETQRSLYNLGIFARVNAAIQNTEGNTSRKYVLYDIEEANRYTLSLGFGAELARFGGATSNLSTPGGATGFSPRVSVDLSRLNFLGLGHVVSLRTRVSNLQQRASINYIAPRFRDVEGRNITFTLLHDDSRDVRTFRSRREEAAIQLSQQLSTPTTALFRFTYRRVSTSDIVIPALLVPALLQPVRIGMISANIAQDRRNDPTDATRGIFNTVDTGLAWSGFGSQRSFYRLLARNATYHRITRNLVFARQTQLGLLFPFNIPQGLSEAEAIPLPERFFGGGSTSHRGFPDNQAGPRDIGSPAGPGGTATQPTGFPLGGNALLFNNMELRFPLLGENIKGVLLHDAGNIYSRIGKISFRQAQRNLQDFDYMVHAVGMGVRYKTPIGPVRVDLVYSINPPSYVGFKGSVQELLACNPNLPPSELPAACRGVQQNVSHFQFFFSIGQTF
ncbi:MAG: BamA/TamA family outer membrane protein [Bryobacterales bacterium]|nr:BamA/TamA family outer membrane protein [Bryobacterales bacterium]